MGDVRTCPVCGVSLVPHDVLGLTVDACPKCSGVFFDQGELGQAVRSGNLTAFAPAPQAPVAQVTQTGSRACPGCKAPMNMYRYAYNSPIILDNCPHCNGIWVDGGELDAIAGHVERSREQEIHRGPAVPQEAAAAVAMLEGMTAANRQRVQTLRSVGSFLCRTVYGPAWGDDRLF